MYENTPRPAVRRVGRMPTVWMDWTTGRGVRSDGQPFKAEPRERRKNPNLADKLDAVAAEVGSAARKVRIMLTGKVPTVPPGGRHWLKTLPDGWSSPRGHWFGNPPTGRFQHNLTGLEVEVRTAAEWFGDTPLTPKQAYDAWETLDAVLMFTFGRRSTQRTDRSKGVLPADMRTTLMLTPAATGMNLWAASLPRSFNPEPISTDIAEELHATSGQHHIEHLVGSDSNRLHEDVRPLVDARARPELEQFTYIDGRFMYASLCRELGTGPAVRLARDKAWDLLQSEGGEYARARYEVRFTVPSGWDHIGIFGMKHSNPEDGWYYPNRPGASGVTWADAAEVFVALRAGWQVDLLQAVKFNERMRSAHKRTGAEGRAEHKSVKAKPMDLWAQKLRTARENIAGDPDLSPVIKQAVGGALRSILINAIGGFSSRGRSSTITVADIKDVPPEYQHTIQVYRDLFVYTKPGSLPQESRPMYRPELSAQVWGRARAKVLSATVEGQQTGALALPGHSILGINGDAIYTTEMPAWALPQDRGGLDDGRAGRARLKGYLAGPVKTPRTADERNQLRAKAQQAGAEITLADTVDQATFPLEFDPVIDAGEKYQAAESTADTTIDSAAVSAADQEGQA
ncbi:MAG: hypothetical protein Q4G40_10575 [Brachybacterium sp.]|nr:hypothetical protein [Brachybacterium sp.]